ncbi:MAG: hypothetical protein LBM08_13995 [Dysgonamonadaceae bacterium]|jgi:hypothetical protein|nr:hypothetical protein [Dysgonamonadaceae bacterium]
MYIFKQISSISLILTISVVLLGFDVVPHHHHHGNVPCFAMEENADSHNTCSHGDCQQPEEKADCTLEQFVVAPAKIYNDSFFTFTCNHPANLFQAVLLSILYDFTIPEIEIPDREFSYILSYHSIVAARNTGMRAPPVL